MSFCGNQLRSEETSQFNNPECTKSAKLPLLFILCRAVCEFRYFYWWLQKANLFKRTRSAIEKAMSEGADNLPDDFGAKIDRAESEIKMFKQEFNQYKSLVKGYEKRCKAWSCFASLATAMRSEPAMRVLWEAVRTDMCMVCAERTSTQTVCVFFLKQRSHRGSI